MKRAILAAALSILAGCSGAPFQFAPPAADETLPKPDGSGEFRYDINDDGVVDYVELRGPDGHVGVVRFPGDDTAEVTWPPSPEGLRHLIVVVDSVPFNIVSELKEHGRFGLFGKPTRILAPFPVMTDVSLSDFFGTTPVAGVESQYYDGTRINVGSLNYAGESNSPWLQHVDYHLPYSIHGLAYLNPYPWNEYDLQRTAANFLPSDEEVFCGYLVSGSALGAYGGHDAHLLGLIRLDRFCQGIVAATHGQTQITIMSDHGHDFSDGRRVPIRENLTRCGYRVADTLVKSSDVVMPAYGLVTCASLYAENAPQLAADAVQMEGVELAMYIEQDDEDENAPIVVVSPHGRARILRRGDAWSYRPDFGDPLKMAPLLTEAAASGKLDSDGFMQDDEWLALAEQSPYPDAPRRIWRAFHELIVYTPTVYLSLADGYYSSNAFINSFIELKASHGSMTQQSTFGFCMTTAGDLPRVVRMDKLANALRALGLPIDFPNGRNEGS